MGQKTESQSAELPPAFPPAPPPSRRPCRPWGGMIARRAGRGNDRGNGFAAEPLACRLPDMVATAAVSSIEQALEWPRRDVSTLKHRPVTRPRKETHVTFSERSRLNGNYLDEVWTLDNRAGGITIAQLNGGSGSHRLFYHQNTLYSVFALTDETGAIVEGYMYDAYGRQSVDTSSGSDSTWFTGDDAWTVGGTSAVGNPYFNKGQRFDPETGNEYDKRRYYSSGLGRFLSRDPIGYWAQDANLYEYVESNPITFVDPSGLARDCDAEHNACWKACWAARPPWPCNKGDRCHYAYCEAKCLAEYLECEAEEHPIATFVTVCATVAAVVVVKNPAIVLRVSRWVWGAIAAGGALIPARAAAEEKPPPSPPAKPAPKPGDPDYDYSTGFSNLHSPGTAPPKK